ncbi:hypothetical protein KCP70_13850 [Salmonella enterica subsp. enterica]|nr:hypothetical protein KCP70_13850 [Salmonella enterica subsp. enterica]
MLAQHRPLHDASFYAPSEHQQQVAAILNDPEASENDKYGERRCRISRETPEEEDRRQRRSRRPARRGCRRRLSWVGQRARLDGRRRR